MVAGAWLGFAVLLLVLSSWVVGVRWPSLADRVITWLDGDR